MKTLSDVCRLRLMAHRSIAERDATETLQGERKSESKQGHQIPVRVVRFKQCYSFV